MASDNSWNGWIVFAGFVLIIVGAMGARSAACSSASSASCWRCRSAGSAASAIPTMLADTMMPEAHEHGGRLVGLLATLGFAVAFAIHTLD
jgi:ZIP family zinc transporter